MVRTSELIFHVTYREWESGRGEPIDIGGGERPSGDIRHKWGEGGREKLGGHHGWMKKFVLHCNRCIVATQIFNVNFVAI